MGPEIWLKDTSKYDNPDSCPNSEGRVDESALLARYRYWAQNRKDKKMEK